LVYTCDDTAALNCNVTSTLADPVTTCDVSLANDDPFPAGDDYRKQNVEMAGLPVLGTTQDIPDLVKGKDIRLILFAISKINRADRLRILEICEGTGARVVVIPDLIEMLKKPDCE